MIVTTSERPEADTVERAKRLADELHASYVPRSNKTIRALYAMWAVDEIVVVSPREVRLLQEGQHPFYFHPSMALVRLKRLRTGGNDTLLTVSGVAEGDTVLDCTAGLCSDALVFSYAAGTQGKVIAIEASRVLHAIVREGLQTYETGLADIDEAMRAIRTVHGEHRSILQRMEDKSADVVYFDPMFEKPVTTSSSIVPLRSQAIREPLSAEAVKDAIRIARKKVVLKDHRDSGQFERLGFRLVRVSASAVAYGVIDID
ncbi:class I SAM-dependent methyltransferase [Cohnella silvisoli]|uniref:Class I SAM-dependent methyltransferase n=1 Tax=Cohnella silvisoli TaxID=2873699 RepID=A0ABV1KNS3_9BACL|nr:class I SAM-dependent methyltransferase [Cohnella silvisoli]MCD9021020.1 class I SAM-dependent methyltransferase [Cohnella silvisoli]